MRSSYDVLSYREEEEEFKDEPLSSREFVIAICCLTAVFVLVFVNNSFLPKPKPLVVHLENMSVSNFSVGESKVEGVWDADVVLMNPNSESKIHISRLESFVYKEGKAMSCAASEAMRIRSRRQEALRLRMNVERCGDQLKEAYCVSDRHVLEQINEERKIGTLRFELRMNLVLQSSFQPGRFTMWQPAANLVAKCSGLRVGFEGDSGDGKLIQNSMSCLVSPNH